MGSQHTLGPGSVLDIILRIPTSGDPICSTWDQINGEPEMAKYQFQALILVSEFADFVFALGISSFCRR